MKLILPCLFTVLLLCGCQSNLSEKASEQEGQTSKAATNELSLEPIDAKTYQAALLTNRRSSIEQLCEESKGYRRNQWQGLNECDWAIEKQLLDLEKTQAKRNENVLSLKLGNEKWLTIEHEANGTYYQYKGYLAKIKSYLVLITKAQECPSFWLINPENGSKQHVSGVPYFSADQQKAFVTSVNSTTSKACNNQIELWTFNDGTLQQQRSYPTKDRITEKLFWKGNKEVVLRQSSLETDHRNEYFAKINL